MNYKTISVLSFNLPMTIVNLVTIGPFLPDL